MQTIDYQTKTKIIHNLN